jgi:HSP20 family protein
MSLTPYTRELGPGFDRWFESPFRGWDRRPSSPAFPPVDAYSDDEGLVVRLEVPGIPPESLSIETQENLLVVKAEAPDEKEGADRHRAFTRSFRLPEYVDSDRAEARHEHGVLTVRIPKSEAVKPHQIKVKIH